MTARARGIAFAALALVLVAVVARLFAIRSMRPPRLAEGEQVAYPVELLQSRIEGSVRLRVLVSASGQADSVEVDSSSGSRVVDSIAQAELRKKRFVPAERWGCPSAAWLILPVEFRRNALKLPPDSILRESSDAQAVAQGDNVGI